MKPKYVRVQLKDKNSPSSQGDCTLLKYVRIHVCVLSRNFLRNARIYRYSELSERLPGNLSQKYLIEVRQVTAV